MKDHLNGVPEIRVLDIGQIVKSMRVGIEYSPIRLGLSRNLFLVPPDQQDPSTEDDTDETRVKTEMNVEGIDISWCPRFPEELWRYSISTCPSHDCLISSDRQFGWGTNKSKRR